jgi:hypothetical protein
MGTRGEVLHSRNQYGCWKQVAHLVRDMVCSHWLENSPGTEERTRLERTGTLASPRHSDECIAGYICTIPSGRSASKTYQGWKGSTQLDSNRDIEGMCECKMLRARV